MVWEVKVYRERRVMLSGELEVQRKKKYAFTFIKEVSVYIQLCI